MPGRNIRWNAKTKPKGPELEVISRQIANAHTAFNVCCALLWLPFLPWMVRLVCALVPEDR